MWTLLALLGCLELLTVLLACVELSGRWQIIVDFLWVMNSWVLVLFLRRRGFTLVRFIWDFVLRLGEDLLGLCFDDEVGDDGASLDDPVEAEDMHAGAQTYAQTQGTSFAETALSGHSAFEVAGMPLQNSPQFSSDASSATSAPAYAAFLNFAMGGPRGSDSRALPFVSAPLAVLVRHRRRLQMHQRCKQPVEAFTRRSLRPTPLFWRRLHPCAFSVLASVYNVQDLWWGQRSWRALDEHLQAHSIDSVVVTLLQQHGYSGPRCVTKP